MRRVADRDHRDRRAAPGGGVGPAAQRLLVGAQVGRGPSSSQVSSSTHRGVAARRRPARRPASPPRSPGSPATVGEDPVARGACAPGCRGTRGPAPRRCARRRAPARAGRGRRTRGTPSRRRRCRTSGRRGGVVGPASASGPWQRRAPRRRAAALAGQAERRSRRAGSAPAPGPSRSAAADRSVHLAAGSGAARGSRSRSVAGAGDRDGRPARGPVARGAAISLGPAGAEQVLAPRPCARTRRPARPRPPARRAAAAPRGCGGTARAARRAGRRRRPRWRPGRGRATGAKAAARVPTTIRRAPRLTARKSR